MAKPGGSKKPMMKISLPPHSEESAPPVVHPSLSAKGPGGSAKGTTAAHVDMPIKEKKKESPFVFSIDVLTSAITLPVTERTPARISMHLKEKYKSEFMIELYTLTKVPPNATINENERIGCLIRNSNFSSSYLEYLVEQNRQLAANLDNSQEAVVALAAEVEKLTKRLAHLEDPTGSRAASRALDSPTGLSGERRKSSKKHRMRDANGEVIPSSRRSKSGKKHSSTATTESSKPAPALPPSVSSSSAVGVERVRSGSPLLRSPGGGRKEDTTVTTVTRTDTPPKRISDSGVDKTAPAPPAGTTITTITTTTIITKQQTTSPAPAPASPRVAQSKRPPRKNVPGLDLQQSLKAPAMPNSRSNGGGSGVLGQASPTVKGTPTKSPPSTAHAPERDKIMPTPVMLSDRSGGSHHCLDVEGKLGACRQCPARCAAFRPHSTGPSWMCAECGHLNIKHLGSPRSSQP